MKKTVSLLFFLTLSLCGLAQEQHVVVLTEAGTLQQKVAEAGLEQAESLLHYLDLSRARIVKQGDSVKEDEIPDNGLQSLFSLRTLILPSTLQRRGTESLGGHV